MAEAAATGAAAAFLGLATAGFLAADAFLAAASAADVTTGTAVSVIFSCVGWRCVRSIERSRSLVLISDKFVYTKKKKFQVN